MTFRLPWQTRRDLAALPETLSTLAAHIEIRGHRDEADAVRATARTLAAMAPRARGSLLRAVREDPAPSTAAFGAPSSALLERIVREGSHAVLRASRERLPIDLGRLLEVPGVTLDEVLDLHRRFGIVTAADVVAAATESGQEASDQEVLAVHARLMSFLPRLRRGHARLPLGRAVALADEMRAIALEALPGEEPPEPVGSLRRFEPTVGDTALMMTAASPATALARLADALGTDRVTHRGPHAVSGLIRDEQVTVHAVQPDVAAAARVCYTGSGVHVARLQALASDRGWQLSPSGLSAKAQGSGLRAQVKEPHLDWGTLGTEAVQSEAGLYARLGLQYVPPELRHGLDELALAAEGRLPTPLELRDIRGDLHTHTLWSDGRDSVVAMVVAARELGYEYVAITDHSQTAAASRVLTRERLARQREDVERSRISVPGIVVLHGVEVDILPDGSLDFPDEVLVDLDFVLASLHDPAGQPADVILERYLSAMRHPLVNAITHPANRLVGRHEGYPIDYDELFRIAVETGTALEVDGGPAHLDLDGHLARRAVQAGVTLTVDSDCHNAARLGRQMQLGLGTARRGGVEARHVLNARPLREVLDFVGRKRRGAAPLAGGAAATPRQVEP